MNQQRRDRDPIELIEVEPVLTLVEPGSQLNGDDSRFSLPLSGTSPPWSRGLVFFMVQSRHYAAEYAAAFLKLLPTDPDDAPKQTHFDEYR